MDMSKAIREGRDRLGMSQEALAERLGGMAALAEPGRRGESRYYVSDSVEDFSRLASIFLRQDVAAEGTQVDIWRY